MRTNEPIATLERVTEIAERRVRAYNWRSSEQQVRYAEVLWAVADQLSGTERRDVRARWISELALAHWSQAMGWYE
jgi:hypothetical protein